MTARLIFGTAAICRQGHVASADIDLFEPTSYCQGCGAAVIAACPTCGTPIRGMHYWRGPASGLKRPLPNYHYERPGFCGSCGEPYPWAGRRESIAELINRLDSEELDPAEKLEAIEELEVLVDPNLPEEEQVQRWEKVRRIAPKVIAGSGRILERIITDAIRQQMGL